MRKIESEIMDMIVLAGLEDFADVVNNKIEESVNELVRRIENDDYSTCTKEQAVRSMELDINFVARKCSVELFSDLMFNDIDRLMDKVEVIENELKMQFKKELYANL